MSSEEPYVEVTYNGNLYHVPLSYANEEHPGGGHYITDYAGKDITEAFKDESHSEEAESILEGFRVGAEKSNAKGKVENKTKKSTPSSSAPSGRKNGGCGGAPWGLVLVVAAVTIGVVCWQRATSH